MWFCKHFTGTLGYMNRHLKTDITGIPHRSLIPTPILLPILLQVAIFIQQTQAEGNLLALHLPATLVCHSTLLLIQDILIQIIQIIQIIPIKR